MLGRLYSWYGRTVVWGILLMLIILILLGVIFSGKEDSVEITEDTRRIVSTANVGSLTNSGSLRLIGSVEAVSRADIQTESSGRITSVQAVLGGTITAGQVLGQIENASQRAAVLQAQGAYEAALAAAAQSDSSVNTAQTSLTTAQNSGINTFRSTFSTADNAIRNTIDFLFSNPTGNIIGYKLDPLGSASEINNSRKTIEGILLRWSSEVTSQHDPADAASLLTQAENDLTLIGNFAELIASTAANDNNDGVTLDGTSITTIRSNLNGTRVEINTARQSVETAIRTIENAQDALVRAEIGGQNTGVSAANAQVKQALGSLRAAEANLEKTIFRSPISGTVNSLNMKVGDFVNSFTTVAVVANNNAFEITTFVSENDVSKLAVGGEVLINENQTGTIVTIAPGIDPDTKKIEVKIATESNQYASGDTIRISIPVNQGSTTERLAIPITALKVETDRIVVFTVSNEGILEAHAVSEGPLLGSSIIIEEGITEDMDIVLDARGLNEGDEVTVSST